MKFEISDSIVIYPENNKIFLMKQDVIILAFYLNTFQVFSEMFHTGHEFLTQQKTGKKKIYCDEEKKEAYFIFGEDSLHISFRAYHASPERRRVTLEENLKFSLKFNILTWTRFAQHYKSCLMVLTNINPDIKRNWLMFLNIVSEMTVAEEKLIFDSLYISGLGLFDCLVDNDLYSSNLEYHIYQNLEHYCSIISIIKYFKNIRYNDDDDENRISDSDSSQEA